MTTSTETIGAQIKQLREKRGLSIEALSLQSGIAEADITGCEANQRPPSLQILERLLDHLRPVTPLYLSELVRLRAAERRDKPPEDVPSSSAARSTSWWKWLWPDVDTAEGARIAAREAFSAAVCSVVIFVAAPFWPFYGFPKTPGTTVDVGDFGATFALGLVLAAVFGLIAWGLYKQSRLAAIVGLILFTLLTIDQWIASPPRNPVLRLLIILGFVAGVRGTFALRRSTPNPPIAVLAPRPDDGPRQAEEPAWPVVGTTWGEFGEIPVVQRPGSVLPRMTGARWLLLGICLAAAALALFLAR